MRNSLGPEAAQPITTELHALITHLHHQREHQRITQASLAQALGLTEVSVSGWETKHDTPTAANFILWAEALGHRVTLTDNPGTTRTPARPIPPVNGERPQHYRLRCLVLTLREKRKTLGATQQTAAAHLGVSTWTLSQWENSTRTPSLPNLIGWSHTLHCRITLTRH